MKQAPVGVFGGTFNPIHYGHLRSAQELRARLGLAEVRMMLSAQPPHREVPQLDAAQRARLVHLALQNEAGMVCDERELKRSGPSYTIDSLSEIRRELGPSRSIVLAMGIDVLNKLNNWHRWREIIDFAHIVALDRPGCELSQEGAVSEWLRQYQTGSAEILVDTPAGCVMRVKLQPHDISATHIREKLSQGRSVRDAVPTVVWQEIEKQNMYGQSMSETRGD